MFMLIHLPHCLPLRSNLGQNLLQGTLPATLSSLTHLNFLYVLRACIASRIRGIADVAHAQVPEWERHLRNGHCPLCISAHRWCTAALPTPTSTKPAASAAPSATACAAVAAQPAAAQPSAAEPVLVARPFHVLQRPGAVRRSGEQPGSLRCAG